MQRKLSPFIVALSMGVALYRRAGSWRMLVGH
jgi:hypothetical protein